jgi:Polyketide cyclase / dehydrase and lipid transport
MSVDVAPEIVIFRPRAAVAAYMFDPRNDANWTSGVIESRPLQEGRLGKGSRVERISKFLGRRFGYTYEVVHTDDDRLVEMSVTKPFPMQIRYELEDVPQGTLVRTRLRGR